MDLAALERRLQQHADIDVQAEYARFQQLVGSQDLDRFLAYLCDRGLITGALLRELHGVGRARVAPVRGIHSDGTLLLGPPDQPAQPHDPSEADTRVVPSTVDTNDVLGAQRAMLPAGTDSSPVEAPGYEMLGRVGRGAMSDVFVARDRELLRKVALKRLTPNLASRPNTVARFFNEVQVTAQLDHPSVVPIHSLEVGNDGVPGYTMKLIQGRTLTELLAEAREQAADSDRRAEARRLTQRLESFIKVCDAMSYAHSKGVLHRDLKPDNIMIGHYNEVYVMDWGICRIMEEGELPGGTRDRGQGAASRDSGLVQPWVPPADLAWSPDAAPSEPSPEVREWESAPDQEWDSAAWQEGDAQAPVPLRTGGSGARYTQHGAIVGTPAYMSPEQTVSRGPPIDARSDLYALGLILFELVALRPALAGGGTEATLLRASQAEKHPLVHHNPRLPIPRELRAIIDKATALERDQRYPDVDAFAADIRAFLRGDAVSARPDTPLQALMRWLGRHKLVTLLAMTVLLLAGASTTIGVLVHKEGQLRAARHREERVQAFLLAVSRHSHAIDNHFATFEKGLARLSGRVQEVLDRNDLAGQPIYFSEDFESLDRAPPDLTLARRYGQPASLDHPVFKLAPRVHASAAARDLQRLSRLTPAFQELMLETAGDTGTIPSADLRHRIANQGVPITRAFVSLESGVHMSYPGLGGFPPEYDGRLRPKYRLAEGRPGIIWGNPYLDRYGLGLMLPAATSIHDGHGKLAGVAGLDMAFDWLIENLLALPGAPYVETCYLVDGARDIVIQVVNGEGSTGVVRGGASGRDLHDNRAIVLEPLPFPAVRAALAERRAGHVGFAHGGRRKIAAFYPVDTLGWSYVVVADRGALLATTAPPLREDDGPRGP